MVNFGNEYPEPLTPEETAAFVTACPVFASGEHVDRADQRSISPNSNSSLTTLLPRSLTQTYTHTHTHTHID
jgi:hypothetical protein